MPAVVSSSSSGSSIFRTVLFWIACMKVRQQTFTRLYIVGTQKEKEEEL